MARSGTRFGSSFGTRLGIFFQKLKSLSFFKPFPSLLIPVDRPASNVVAVLKTVSPLPIFFVKPNGRFTEVVPDPAASKLITTFENY